MMKTANFPTLLCYDRLFCDITYSVTSCTENEAHRYGRFLCAVLQTVMRWHSKKSIFEEECINYPGFVTKYRVSNQYSEACDLVGYENYRHVCHKWQCKMAKAIIICLESKDYVQIRNSLIILIKILPHFPVMTKLCGFIEKRAEKVRDEEKGQRQDLYILATSYIGQLKSRIPFMMRESDFHQVSERQSKKTESVPSNDDHSSKIVNGEVKDKEKLPNDRNKDSSSKDRNEKKSVRKTSPTSQQAKSSAPDKNFTDEVVYPTKDKSSRDRPKEKELEQREKQQKKEEKREEIEREKEKRRERKEEKLAYKEERQYREDRYLEMVSPKDDSRYSGGSAEHYYYYQDQANGSRAMHRHSQEPPEPEPRDVKRRKMESNSSKNSKFEEPRSERGGGSGSSGKQIVQPIPSIEYQQTIAVDRPERVDKKERSSKNKEKREKQTDEEKELRRERKLGRKRDRAEEALQAEQKRRKEEEKVKSISNGEIMEIHVREKHHHSRSQEKSPYGRERERSHDRIEPRDKHRRSTESKRR